MSKYASSIPFWGIEILFDGYLMTSVIQVNRILKIKHIVFDGYLINRYKNEVTI